MENIAVAVFIYSKKETAAEIYIVLILRLFYLVSSCIRGSQAVNIFTKTRISINRYNENYCS